MMEGNTLTVDSSEHGYFPEGMTVTVERDHTNPFTERRVLNLQWDNTEAEVPNRTAAPLAQVYQMPDEDVWTEIHTGLAREHEKLTFEEDV